MNVIVGMIIIITTESWFRRVFSCRCGAWTVSRCLQQQYMLQFIMCFQCPSLTWKSRRWALIIKGLRMFQLQNSPTTFFWIYSIPIDKFFSTNTTIRGTGIANMDGSSLHMYVKHGGWSFSHHLPVYTCGFFSRCTIIRLERQLQLQQDISHSCR